MTRKSQARRRRGQIVAKPQQSFAYPAAPYQEPAHDHPIVTRAVRQALAEAGLAAARAQWRRQIALVAAHHQAAKVNAAHQEELET